MIVGNKITKRYGTHTLFSNFDFHIDDGEFVCFSGKSGSGKTTLLNMIGLLEPIDSGTLVINGKTWNRSRDKRTFYREEVGFLFQNFALIENKTVRQNLAMVIQGIGNRHSMESVLSAVGLQNKIDAKVFTLSGGEQQRVALARLMLKPCNIVLADEPTGSLDIENAKIVMDLLRQINASGKTVVMVTHDEQFKKQADRIICLD